MRKTVIFGGTFNPIHNAHVKMVEEVSKLDFVERILIIPTFIPPHKTVKGFFASGKDRMEMCKLALGSIKKVKFCDLELNNNAKSYTINTLKTLKENFPNTDFALLIGGDMISSFNKWYCYEEILKYASILAVKRNTVDDAEFDSSVNGLIDIGADITVLQIETQPFSSSNVRNFLEKGLDVSEFLDKKVIEYINKNNLYR